jgi:hypothetical protein
MLQSHSLSRVYLRVWVKMTVGMMTKYMVWLVEGLVPVTDAGVIVSSFDIASPLRGSANIEDIAG